MQFISYVKKESFLSSSRVYVYLGTRQKGGVKSSKIAVSRQQQEAKAWCHENVGHHSASTKMTYKRKRAEEVPKRVQDTEAGLRSDRDEQDRVRPSKRAQSAKSGSKKAPPKSKPKRTATPKSFPKAGPHINQPPTVPLEIFVFGDGSSGELGLGSKIVNGQSLTDVTQPRMNKLLSSEDVGVVQITCGGMHAVALTRDNKILTWGVNDLGALGRATDVEEDDDDEFNPAESTPGPVDISGLGPDIRWAQVAASDNASFALTDDGRVYGWGTFRVCIFP